MTSYLRGGPSSIRFAVMRHRGMAWSRMTPLYKKVVSARRHTRGSSESPLSIADQGWSVYGAKRTQPVATGGK